MSLIIILLFIQVIIDIKVTYYNSFLSFLQDILKIIDLLSRGVLTLTAVFFFILFFTLSVYGLRAFYSYYWIVWFSLLLRHLFSLVGSYLSVLPGEVHVVPSLVLTPLGESDDIWKGGLFVVCGADSATYRHELQGQVPSCPCDTTLHSDSIEPFRPNSGVHGCMYLVNSTIR